MPGRSANAHQAFQRAISLIAEELEARPGNHINRVRLAKYWAYLGDADRALAELAKLPERAFLEVQVVFQTAIIHELIGRRAEAIEKLLVALRGGLSASQITQEPVFADLKNSPKLSSYLNTADTAAASR